MTRNAIICGSVIALFPSAAWCAEPAVPTADQTDHRETVTVGGHTFGFISFHDPASGVPWFNATLEDRHTPGELVSCRLLVEVPVTHYEQAFGGSCVLRNNGQDVWVRVCNDTAVGNFKIMPTDIPPTEDDLAKFTLRCAGG